MYLEYPFYKILISKWINYKIYNSRYILAIFYFCKPKKYKLDYCNSI